MMRSVLYTWLCLLLCGLSTRGTASAELFPYGQTHGDLQLTAEDLHGPNKLSGVVSVLPKVSLYTELFRDLHISAKGFLTFVYGSLDTSAPLVNDVEPFSEDFPPSPYYTETIIIAPLWAEFDPNASGTVHFRVTRRIETLQRVTEAVKRVSPVFQDYEPIVVAVVTWEGVVLRDHHSQNFTFQAAVSGQLTSADEYETVVLFLYQRPEDVQDISQPHVIGFNAGDQMRFINIDTTSISGVNAFRVEGNCVADLSEDISLATFNGTACYNNDSQSEDGNSTFCPDSSVLLPYGATAGDLEVPRQDDVHVGPIQLQSPGMMVFGCNQQALYISTNGIISFGGPFLSIMPEEFGEDFIQHFDTLISPLWADFNPSQGEGRVFYRSTDSARDLDSILEVLVRFNAEIEGFRPTQAVVVTWYRVPTFSEGQDIVYTFQVAIVTDNVTTFAAYIYEDPCSIQSGLPAMSVIGFSKGDRRRFSNIGRESVQSVNTYRIDGDCITSVLPSDSCTLNSVAYECEPESLTASTCACDQGVESPKCLRHVYPFGGRNGDSTVPQGIDEVVGPFELLEPVIFFQKTEREFHVSTNGFISLGARDPSSQRVSALPTSSVPLVAPLWADFDFRESGTVYYRTTTEPSLLDSVAGSIAARNSELEGFTPTMCLVVTWAQAVLFSGSFSDSAQIFQVVLATDSRTTFALYIYENTTTISAISSGGTGVVGFDAGDQKRSAAISTLENVNIFRVDGNCITSVLPNVVCGLNFTSFECAENSLAASSCLCAGFNDSDDITCQLKNFFRFGVGSEDEVVSGAIDGFSTRISLDVPIVYNQHHFTEFYVATNGFVSFERKFNNSHVIPSTVTFRFLSDVAPLIAPLWADLNFRDSGIIYYKVSSDEDMLREIAQRIRVETGDPAYAEFMPRVVVIVTWFQGELLRSGKVVNFQLALASDGLVSFAILLYGDTADLADVHFLVGFLSGDGTFRHLLTSDHTIIPSGSSIVFRIDGYCIPYLQPHDECGLQTVPLRCPAIEDQTFHTPQTCLCHAEVTSGDNVSCINYFPYGPTTSDRTSFKSGLSTDTNLTLPYPLKYYGKNHTSLNLSFDGYISLGAFPTSFSSLSDSLVPLIAPLWTTEHPAETEIGKFLYFRVVSDPSAVEFQIALDRITRANPNITDFSPDMVVVASWLLEGTYLFTSAQCILVSGGGVTFALFLYESPSDVVWGLDYRLVGFDAGDGGNYTSILDIMEFSLNIQESNIYRIDGSCVTSAVSGSVCGLNSVATQCDGLAATVCSCNQGYAQQTNLTCTDIDECDEDQDICDVMPNSNCANLPGSYVCECNHGFRLNGSVCQDINECASDPDPCGDDVNSVCENTPGSYECGCEPGYSRNGQICEDFDECEDSTDACRQVCVNSNGSYTCDCFDGFLLQSDGVTCAEADLVPTIVSAVVMGCVLIIFIIVMLVIVLYIRRQRKLKKRRLRRASRVSEQNGNEYFHHLRHFTVHSSFKHNLPRSLIVPSCNLTLGETIGQGEFGIVYKGRLKNNFSDQSGELVAVKTLKGFVQRELVKDLLLECGKMYQFDHPNVLKLSGVCLDGGPAPYIIMPFMTNGSLLSHLKKNRATLIVEMDCDPDDVRDVEKKLLDMCLQVAKGMEYLASKRIIHRDLAARNCMIDVNFVIKVADFGLSEATDVSKDYFRQDHDDAVKLPVKWLAPESMHDGVFSEKSDVWSYGITCWEIFSGGKSPYPGIHAVDLPPKLDSGYRMAKPVNAACSNETFSVILDCWKSQPTVRPSFSDIVDLLSSKLSIAADYLEMNGVHHDFR